MDASVFRIIERKLQAQLSDALIFKYVMPVDVVQFAMRLDGKKSRRAGRANVALFLACDI